MTSELSPINTRGQDHAPYTVDACELVGTLAGELGKALASSQAGVAEAEKLLQGEMKRVETEDDEQALARARLEAEWWQEEKKARLEAAEESKKKRRRKKKAPYKRKCLE